MSKLQRINLAGASYVVLAENEYEDLVDSTEAASQRARIAAGEETYPDAVIGAILDGANPVRTFRQWRDMKASVLAKEAGIGQSYLSEIETGKKDGSVKALKAIANTLHVDMEMLIVED